MDLNTQNSRQKLSTKNVKTAKTKNFLIAGCFSFTDYLSVELAM